MFAVAPESIQTRTGAPSMLTVMSVFNCLRLLEINNFHHRRNYVHIVPWGRPGAGARFRQTCPKWCRISHWEHVLLKAGHLLAALKFADSLERAISMKEFNVADDFSRRRRLCS